MFEPGNICVEVIVLHLKVFELALVLCFFVVSVNASSKAVWYVVHRISLTYPIGF